MRRYIVFGCRFILALLSLSFFYSCIKLKLTTTLDFFGPHFEFSITNLTTSTSIVQENATIDASSGDKIELRVKVNDSDEAESKTITISLFDIEEKYENEDVAVLSATVPKIESGIYPATVVFERVMPSTNRDKWIGNTSREKTMYISIVN